MINQWKEPEKGGFGEFSKVPCCSDILETAKAGIEFYDHQRRMEVTQLHAYCTSTREL